MTFPRPAAAVGALTLALALALGLAGCVDSKGVLVQQPLYLNPSAPAEGFLGYNDTTAGTPVCGNCHIGMERAWKGTKHAHAWSDLEASGHATASCEGCHTVNANGNRVDTIAGFTATRDALYHDVQCESCHGPGLQHVTNPDASQPLASVLVGEGLTNGCGQCHHTARYPFLEEWSQSEHGMVTHQSTAIRVGAECLACHSGDGALEAWGINVDYLEKDSLAATGGHIGIVCAVCHDPHDATNEYQLRFPIDVADVGKQLCMKCHHERAVPDQASSRGPMSPQGPLLLGQAGWRPPDFMPPDSVIVMTHGTVSANPELCATCHMHRFQAADSAGYHSTGHLFQAIPCLDAKGVPNAGDCDVSQRDFDACAASGCHASADVARSLFGVATQRLAALTAQVNALVAQVPASEFVTGDNHITTGEGAKFNAELASMTGTAVHNPFLMEALLTASIKQLEQDYGLQASPSLSLNNILGSRR